MKRLVIGITILLVAINFCSGQDSLLIKFQPISFPYFNIDYQLYKTSFLLSPCMSQSLNFTTGLYNLSYFLLYKTKPFRQKQFSIKNYLLKIISMDMLNIFLTYIPGGDSWLHEEFHRSELTLHKVRSFDQVYNLPFFSSVIDVNHVSDKDLIRFKKQAPYDFIRLTEAGIEGEYGLVRNLQKLNFYYNANYPYFLSELSITLNSIFYVWMCHTDIADQETDKFNNKGKYIWQRDFTGLDFTAWVYDLFNPMEPYTARGIHPSGVGINRYIKPSQLTVDEYNFLKLQGYLQILNIVSPFLLNINQFKVKGKYYNFALRHTLTSFGYDISLDIFTKNEGNFIYSIHLFRNYQRFYPGFGLELFRNKLNSNNYLSISSLFGLQPQDLHFFTNHAMPVGFLRIEFEHYFKRFGIFFYISAKNQGWIPYFTYQNPNISFGAGLCYKK